MDSHTETARISSDALLASVRQGGDAGAWRELVARLTPALYQVARGLTAWRVVGAQTVTERSWRAAIRTPHALSSHTALRRALMEGAVRWAHEMGDTPRDRLTDDAPDRLAAMRAVALLPHPARTVLVLSDIGGLPLDDISTVLSLPAAQVKSELWHARLAVDTLRGAGVGDDMLPAAHTDPALQDRAERADSTGGDYEVPVGIAPIWEEPLPAGMVDRLAADLLYRFNRRRRFSAASRHLPILVGLLAAVVLLATGVLWHELPRLARGGTESYHALSPVSALTEGDSTDARLQVRVLRPRPRATARGARAG